MVCPKRQDKIGKKNVHIVALGLLPDRVEEICCYSEKELLESELDVIEKIPIVNKHQARQDFIQMCIRYGFRDFNSFERLPYTHQERVMITQEFVKEIRSMKHICSSYLAGSMVGNGDHQFSDVDLIAIRKKCPGENKCMIFDLERSEKYRVLDIWCYSKGEFEKLKKGKHVKLKYIF